MRKNSGLILKFCLIFNLNFCFIFSESDFNQDSINTANLDDMSNPVLNYPGKPLLMSLVIPGSGQYYMKEPFWKPASFLGVELISILSWITFSKRSDAIKDNYKVFANEHWSLESWVTNRFGMPTSANNDLWQNYDALTYLTGTHSLLLSLSGSLRDSYGDFVSSDSLEIFPDWVNNPDIDVVKDRHFYENIGKYDQFLGGWSDAATEWYWEEKDVGDSTEIVIKTPLKQKYLLKREDSNRLKRYANYSISVVLFNHVISGLEAVVSNQRKAQKNKKSDDLMDADIGLLYSPYSKLGIGGISLSIVF
tara:strand:+ start:785 stop:1705 length:921 start_codon:yes stop_codon:yes gene_type:complete